MTSLLKELRHEHRSMAEVLACLDHQMRIFESGEQPDYDVVLAAIDYFEGFPRQFHHPKEDLIYRRLCQSNPQAARTVGDLGQAHLRLEEDFVRFAAAIRDVLSQEELPRGRIAGWIRDFIDRQRRHLQMEENLFFPAAEAALSDEDWQDLEIAARRPSTMSHAVGTDARFTSLHSLIVAWDSEDRSRQD